MSLKLNFGRDVQGFNAFAPQFADVKFSATLASSGNASVTVPKSFENWIVSFSYTPGSNIWVANNASAAAPAGATFAATSSELNPGSRVVKAGDVINLLNNGANPSDVGVLLYAVS
jgi:hypothetical protein